MHLLIDGYNLLHVTRSLINLNAIQLQWERDRLLDQLSVYRQARPMNMTIVFDGWQGGWRAEKREWRKGIEIIYSKLGEKADEVIKRMVRERGLGVVVVTSDREIAKYAERLNGAVIPSDLFWERLERSAFEPQRDGKKDDEETRGMKKKGPSRRLSKKEKRKLTALKKL